MCGISCVVCVHCDRKEPIPTCQTLSDSIIPALSRRGPDYIKHADIPFGSEEEKTSHLLFTACTLRMRGPPLVESAQAQPLINADGQAFTWNGEIFGGIDVAERECDTTVLFAALTACRPDDDVLSCLKLIKGPFSFVYFDALTQSLWFGRDFFGRRSLLWSILSDDEGAQKMVLSSVADVGSDGAKGEDGSEEEGLAWQEVPAKGIFKLDLRSLARVRLHYLSFA